MFDIDSHVSTFRCGYYVLCPRLHFSDIFDVEQREEEERSFQFRVKQGEEESTLSFRMNRSEAATLAVLRDNGNDAILYKRKRLIQGRIII